jgi:hypothetical protein
MPPVGELVELVVEGGDTEILIDGEVVSHEGDDGLFAICFINLDVHRRGVLRQLGEKFHQVDPKSSTIRPRGLSPVRKGRRRSRVQTADIDEGDLAALVRATRGEDSTTEPIQLVSHWPRLTDEEFGEG